MLSTDVLLVVVASPVVVWLSLLLSLVVVLPVVVVVVSPFIRASVCWRLWHIRVHRELIDWRRRGRIGKR